MCCGREGDDPTCWDIENGDIHVYPTLEKHDLTMDCRCEPERDREEPKVVIHHRMDN